VSGLHPLIARQIAELQETSPGANATPLPDGTTLVSLPDVPLPAGWNQDRTHVWFLVPVGYPAARPDCFFADAGLRLAHGQMPQNTGMQGLPGTGSPHVWFSWHLQAWDPSRDTLLTFARVARDRLHRAQ
jgi:hypothetical protein